MSKRLLLTAPRDLIGAEAKPSKINVPNAVTLAGFGLGVWWVAGGPPWAAVASIIADEADGALARERGETSEFGGSLDWTSDIVLTALTLYKLKVPWVGIPAITTIQVALREEGFRPPALSFRAALMIYAICKDARIFRSSK
jgi:phosphatidylglycerophosphate synthase